MILLVALAYLYRVPFQDWRAGLGKPKNFLAGLDIAQINRIEVNSPSQSTVLDLVGDKWRIGGTKEFYISGEVQTQVMDALNDAKDSGVELAGENSDNKSEFLTDETNGTRVTLKQGDSVLADFIVGKAGNDYTSSYISEPGIAETYLINVNLRSAFDRSDWYDKTIFASAADSITKIRFQYPTREFTVEKTPAEGDNAGGWAGTLPYSFSVDPDKLQPVIDIMANLTALAVPPQTFDNTGLDKNSIIVEASGEGVDNTLMIGNEELDDQNEPTGRVYAKRGDSDNIYLISKDQRDKLDLQIRDLR